MSYAVRSPGRHHAHQVPPGAGPGQRQGPPGRGYPPGQYAPHQQPQHQPHPHQRPQPPQPQQYHSGGRGRGPGYSPADQFQSSGRPSPNFPHAGPQQQFVSPTDTSRPRWADRHRRRSVEGPGVNTIGPQRHAQSEGMVVVADSTDRLARPPPQGVHSQQRQAPGVAGGETASPMSQFVQAQQLIAQREQVAASQQYQQQQQQPQQYQQQEQRQQQPQQKPQRRSAFQRRRSSLTGGNASASADDSAQPTAANGPSGPTSTSSAAIYSSQPQHAHAPGDDQGERDPFKLANSLVEQYRREARLPADQPQNGGGAQSEAMLQEDAQRRRQYLEHLDHLANRRSVSPIYAQEGQDTAPSSDRPLSNPRVPGDDVRVYGRDVGRHVTPQPNSQGTVIASSQQGHGEGPPASSSSMDAARGLISESSDASDGSDSVQRVGRRTSSEIRAILRDRASSGRSMPEISGSPRDRVRARNRLASDRHRDRQANAAELRHLAEQRSQPAPLPDVAIQIDSQRGASPTYLSADYIPGPAFDSAGSSGSRPRSRSPSWRSRQNRVGGRQSPDPSRRSPSPGGIKRQPPSPIHSPHQSPRSSPTSERRQSPSRRAQPSAGTLARVRVLMRQHTPSLLSLSDNEIAQLAVRLEYKSNADILDALRRCEADVQAGLPAVPRERSTGRLPGAHHPTNDDSFGMDISSDSEDSLGGHHEKSASPSKRRSSPLKSSPPKPAPGGVVDMRITAEPRNTNTTKSSDLVEQLREQGVGTVDLLTLDWSNRALREINEVSAFSNLQTLDLSRNFIEQLTGLPTTLRKLNLAHNELSSMAGLNKLKNLEYLDISHNNIATISGINNCTQLQVLLIKGNCLKTIDNILSLRSLEELDLSYNLISRLDALRVLAMNTNLTRLWIEGNPISSSSYRWSISHYAPSVRVLDDEKMPWNPSHGRKTLADKAEKRNRRQSGGGTATQGLDRDANSSGGDYGHRSPRESALMSATLDGSTRRSSRSPPNRRRRGSGRRTPSGGRSPRGSRNSSRNSSRNPSPIPGQTGPASLRSSYYTSSVLDPYRQRASPPLVRELSNSQLNASSNLSPSQDPEMKQLLVETAARILDQLQKSNAAESSPADSKQEAAEQRKKLTREIADAIIAKGSNLRPAQKPPVARAGTPPLAAGPDREARRGPGSSQRADVQSPSPEIAMATALLAEIDARLSQQQGISSTPPALSSSVVSIEPVSNVVSIKEPPTSTTIATSPPRLDGFTNSSNSSVKKKLADLRKRPAWGAGYGVKRNQGSANGRRSSGRHGSASKDPDSVPRFLRPTQASQSKRRKSDATGALSTGKGDRHEQRHHRSGQRDHGSESPHKHRYNRVRRLSVRRKQQEEEAELAKTNPLEARRRRAASSAGRSASVRRTESLSPSRAGSSRSTAHRSLDSQFRASQSATLPSREEDLPTRHFNEDVESQSDELTGYGEDPTASAGELDVAQAAAAVIAQHGLGGEGAAGNATHAQLQGEINSLNDKIAKLYNWQILGLDLVVRQQMQLSNLGGPAGSTETSPNRVPRAGVTPADIALVNAGNSGTTQKTQEDLQHELALTRKALAHLVDMASDLAPESHKIETFKELLGEAGVLTPKAMTAPSAGASAAENDATASASPPAAEGSQDTTAEPSQDEPTPRVEEPATPPRSEREPAESVAAPSPATRVSKQESTLQDLSQELRSARNAMQCLMQIVDNADFESQQILELKELFVACDMFSENVLHKDILEGDSADAVNMISKITAANFSLNSTKKALSHLMSLLETHNQANVVEARHYVAYLRKSGLMTDDGAIESPLKRLTQPHKSSSVVGNEGRAQASLNHEGVIRRRAASDTNREDTTNLPASVRPEAPSSSAASNPPASQLLGIHPTQQQQQQAQAQAQAQAPGSQQQAQNAALQQVRSAFRPQQPTSTASLPELPSEEVSKDPAGAKRARHPWGRTGAPTASTNQQQRAVSSVVGSETSETPSQPRSHVPTPVAIPTGPAAQAPPLSAPPARTTSQPTAPSPDVPSLGGRQDDSRAASEAGLRISAMAGQTGSSIASPRERASGVQKDTPNPSSVQLKASVSNPQLISEPSTNESTRSNTASPLRYQSQPHLPDPNRQGHQLQRVSSVPHGGQPMQAPQQRVQSHQGQVPPQLSTTTPTANFPGQARAQGLQQPQQQEGGPGQHRGPVRHVQQPGRAPTHISPGQPGSGGGRQPSNPNQFVGRRAGLQNVSPMSPQRPGPPGMIGSPQRGAPGPQGMHGSPHQNGPPGMPPVHSLGPGPGVRPGPPGMMGPRHPGMM